ncbi:MAG TPA: NADH-quinone oxidoreductase subunit I [Candidatus Gastranaerophilales bacterium]|nr:NADH-quinone oxidoreductase subunit I [Candidatus Gastranaerophilales bacterium]
MKNAVNKTISGIIEIARGMATIMKHFFRPSITLEYPEKKPDLPPRFRGRLALLTNSDGTDACIGCKSCVKVCPCVDLIQIETSKDPETKKIVVEQFTIDIGRCIFCGNCTEICPKNAIVSTDEFELADYSRESLVFDKKALTLDPEKSQRLRDKKEKEVK